LRGFETVSGEVPGIQRVTARADFRAFEQRQFAATSRKAACSFDSIFATISVYTPILSSVKSGGMRGRVQALDAPHYATDCAGRGFCRFRGEGKPLQTVWGVKSDRPPDSSPGLIGTRGRKEPL